MSEPKRIWWARPRKLCALERPGGGGRSHRPERRAEEIEYLKDAGVRVVISCMPTRHNLAAYEEAGLEWIHMPVDEDADGLLEVVDVVRRETRKRGAVAIHANRYTDFVAAVCAVHLATSRSIDTDDSLRDAEEAGLTVTPESAELASACASAGVG
jgi:MoaA/NifB/PqqE/SkfB family radical SAM enzyme